MLLGSWLDRLQSSRHFRRAAMAFPLTRPIARRRARDLFDLAGGFVYTQVLTACVQLDLPELLRRGPATAETLALPLGLAPDAARRLLDAATALRITRHRGGGRYGLGPLGAALIDNAGVTAMIRHHALLYDDLRDPVALLRGEAGATRLGRYWSYAGPGEAAALRESDVAPYSALMAASQAMVAEQALAAYPLDGHRLLLDIGGGEGSFLIAAARRAPGLRLALFDLPAVVSLADARLADAGLAGRTTTHGGDFQRDALPSGADLVSVVRVLHDHDDATVMALLRKIRAALVPGGTLLIVEPMADTPGVAAMGGAYFGFYLLAMGRGMPRSAARLTRMLRDAGFTRCRTLPTHLPLVTQLISARRSRNDPQL